MGSNIRSVIFLVIFIMFIITAVFRADISSAALTSVGPTSEVTHFPLFYSDSNGLALELCLTAPDTGPPCFFDPVIGGNALSAATGFGGEAFWFLSEASIDEPAVSGLLVMAVEAAYGAGDPTPNDQVSFTRIRIRVDVLNGTPAGTYTITHPYGVNTYEDIAACATNPGRFCDVINVTIDVGIGAPGDFTGALKGKIGPFLTMDPADPNYASIRLAWPGYIGNSDTLVKVVGSPSGTNYFRIQGPGGIDLTQDLFTLMGKFYTGSIPTPLSIDRASYSRSAADGNPGFIDLFATSAGLASLSVSGDGITPNTPLTGDGSGRFFVRIPLAPATTLPTNITVAADNSATYANNTPTVDPVALTDFVTAKKADYNPVAGILTIEASSGDEAAPPVLTAAGFELTGGGLVLSTATPTSFIQVLSTSGGTEARKVRVVRP